MVKSIQKVLLAGDSISYGYGPRVRSILDGIFEVQNLPEDYRKNSANLLANLDEWMIKPNFDIIHLNCGLHDVLPGSYLTQPIPLEIYEANLEKIVVGLKNGTSSIIVWAMTTPVIDELLERQAAYKGRERDIHLYNEAARKVMNNHNIPINDLHKVIEDEGKEKCILQDGVHMTDLGNELLAKAIADFLLNLKT